MSNINQLVLESINRSDEDRFLKLIYVEYVEKHVKQHLNQPGSTLYKQYSDIPKNFNEFKKNISFEGKDFSGNQSEYLFYGSRKLHNRIFTVLVDPIRVTWDNGYDNAHRAGKLSQFMKQDLGGT